MERYRLVNVSGVRPEPFTGELIVPDEDGLPAVVGLFEEDDTAGNLAAGVSLFNVSGDDLEYTDQYVERDRDDFTMGEIVYTPQLV